MPTNTNLLFNVPCNYPGGIILAAVLLTFICGLVTHLFLELSVYKLSVKLVHGVKEWDYS